jgi:hypothetical protein
LFSMFEKKKTTTNFVIFFDDFVTKKVTIIVILFFGGFVTQKVMATMLLPSSMVVVLWRHRLLSFFLFLIIWSFWSSSLELTINNEMVVFCNVESCNG